MIKKKSSIIVVASSLSCLLLYGFLINVVIKPTLIVGSLKLGSVSSKTIELSTRSYLQEKKITLVSDDKTKIYSLSELGIFFEEKSLEDELKQSQEKLKKFKFIPTNNCCLVKLPEMVIDLSRLDYIWQKDLAVESKTSKNAKLAYKKDTQQFQVSDAVVGLSFDATSAKQAIIDSARNTKERTSTINAASVSQKTDPKIQKSQLLEASARATKIVNHSVAITLEGSVTNPAKEVIASWLVLKTKSGSQPQIVVDPSRVATYLTDVSKKYQIDPTVQIIKSGQVVQQGSNGKKVANIDTASKEIQQRLSEESGLSIDVVLSVADVPFRITDSTPKPKQTGVRYKYRIISKGIVQADLGEFRAQVQETLSSSNSWAASGITFQEVGSNANFDISLTQPGVLASYGGCTADYSCRSGRLVMINDDRWRGAVAHWPLSLRDYRNMVVNHEVGHWLGLGHVNCPRAGAPAPLMQQQSISLQGCTANPWPTQQDRNKLK
jgi:hypothetical protein